MAWCWNRRTVPHITRHVPAAPIDNIDNDASHAPCRISPVLISQSTMHLTSRATAYLTSHLYSGLIIARLSCLYMPHFRRVSTSSTLANGFMLKVHHSSFCFRETRLREDRLTNNNLPMLRSYHTSLRKAGAFWTRRSPARDWGPSRFGTVRRVVSRVYRLVKARRLGHETCWLTHHAIRRPIREPAARQPEPNLIFVPLTPARRSLACHPIRCPSTHSTVPRYRPTSCSSPTTP